MKTIYSHLVFLSDENAEDLIDGKQISCSGFVTKIQEDVDKRKYEDVPEIISFYKMKYNTKSNTISCSKGEFIINFSDENDEIIEKLLEYNSFEEKIEFKATMKFENTKNVHILSFKNIQYFEKSKIFANSFLNSSQI